jgi:hypothetical protein
VYFVLVCLEGKDNNLFKKFVFFCKGISLVSNTLLQNAIVELDAIDLIIRIMESTQYIDIKVRE